MNTCAFAAALAVAAPQPAWADELAQMLHAPADAAPPTVNPAVSYELNFSLEKGSDLPDLLLEAGVNPDDIAAATRLAAGHDGGRAGCYIKVAISKALREKTFKVQRVTLLTETSKTVMERRKGELMISASGARRRSQIV